MEDITINDLTEYISAIFGIQSSNEMLDFKNLDNMILEFERFEEYRKAYIDITNKKEPIVQKNELVDMLKSIIKYCQVLPLYRIMPTYRYQKDNGSFERIDNDFDAGIEYFYRGVYDGAKYNLLPSCFRNGYYGKEDKFYHYVKSRCVNELNNRNHLDTLVTLQHYDCPTRLLDVTSNPLVALYFACKNYG
ncbi:MAG: FRG domain-containing protein, partial [Clostridia bacterium]|nr:FRG domain-containing protein [Clostridia bacterium]